MDLHIHCDFDGTITTEDATDILLEAFADPAWTEIERDWRAGLIGSSVCMERQVALMRASRSALDALIDTIPVDPAFSAFARWCRDEGIELTVVSDGLDYVICRVLARLGVADLPVIANHLVFLSSDRMAMTSPFAARNCEAGTCKCKAIERCPPAGLTLLIGDGRSDFCGAGAAHMVIAKDSLLKHCRGQGFAHYAFSDFRDVLGIVQGLTDRDATPVASGGRFDGSFVPVSGLPVVNA